MGILIHTLCFLPFVSMSGYLVRTIKVHKLLGLLHALQGCSPHQNLGQVLHWLLYDLFEL